MLKIMILYAKADGTFSRVPRTATLNVDTDERVEVGLLPEQVASAILLLLQPAQQSNLAVRISVVIRPTRLI